MRIEYSPKFAREFKRLPKPVKQNAVLREKLFQKNPFDRKLKTHKLSGKLKDFWSFSIDYKYRIIVEFIGNIVRFHAVGDHDVYS